MKIVIVKDFVIGVGVFKIIVSLMVKDIVCVKFEVFVYREVDFDILEWCVDYFVDFFNVEFVMAAVKIFCEIMLEKSLLFIFCSVKEGGEQAIFIEVYIVFNCVVIDSGLVDMIDLELFIGDDQVKEIVVYVYVYDVKVVMFNYDFYKMLEVEEIIVCLCKM